MRVVVLGDVRVDEPAPEWAGAVVECVGCGSVLVLQAFDSRAGLVRELADGGCFWRCAVCGDVGRFQAVAMGVVR